MRATGWLIVRAAALAPLIVGAMPAPSAAADGMLFEVPAAWGAARVIDGDTLAIGPARVRLVGIDAPEAAAPGGALAAGALATLIGSTESVLCVGGERDRWGRVVARCFTLPGGVDLSTALVEAGYARSDKRFSAGRPEAEGRARATQAGLWACPAPAPEGWPKACD